eukprot:472150-Pleurochrysis_carterae.AAC.4
MGNGAVNDSEWGERVSLRKTEWKKSLIRMVYMYPSARHHQTSAATCPDSTRRHRTASPRAINDSSFSVLRRGART